MMPMPKKFDLIQIDAVGFVVCLLASLVVYSAWIHPLIRQRTLQVKQRSALAAQRQEYSRLEASLITVQDQLDIVKGELANSRFDMDSVNRINKRVAMLTTFFSECQLSINSVRAGASHSGRPFHVVPVYVTGTGTSAQYVQFLHRFSKEFSDMSVAAIALTGYPAKAQGMEDFKLELLWYAAPIVEEAVVDAERAIDEVVSKF